MAVCCSGIQLGSRSCGCGPQGRGSNYIDDFATSPFHHVLNHRLSAVESPFEMNVDDAVPLRFAYLPLSIMVYKCRLFIRLKINGDGQQEPNVFHPDLA